MRHNVQGRKLGRTTAHRNALFKNMALSLVEHGRVKTTLAKAKEMKKYADKLITLGKKDTLHARRLAYTKLGNNHPARKAVQKLFDVIAPAFVGRNGGYTRIYKIGHRKGDGAEMAYLEYLQESFVETKEKTKETKTDAKATKKASADKPKAKKKKAAPKKKKVAAA